MTVSISISLDKVSTLSTLDKSAIWIGLASKYCPAAKQDPTISKRTCSSPSISNRDIRTSCTVDKISLDIEIARTCSCHSRVTGMAYIHTREHRTIACAYTDTCPTVSPTFCHGVCRTVPNNHFSISKDSHWGDCTSPTAE